MEQREKLGLNNAPKGRPNGGTPPLEPTGAYQKVEVHLVSSFFFTSELEYLSFQVIDRHSTPKYLTLTFCCLCGFTTG